MMKRDYPAAVVYLNNAYLGDPGNRGVTKMLGYGYAWSGDLDKSEALLNQLSESKQEMETYAWWWNTQGRSDLASYAKVLAKRLE